jgi:hypothetical protein
LLTAYFDDRVHDREKRPEGGRRRTSLAG